MMDIIESIARRSALERDCELTAIVSFEPASEPFQQQRRATKNGKRKFALGEFPGGQN